MLGLEGRLGACSDDEDVATAELVCDWAGGVDEEVTGFAAAIPNPAL